MEIESELQFQIINILWGSKYFLKWQQIKTNVIFRLNYFAVCYYLAIYNNHPIHHIFRDLVLEISHWLCEMLCSDELQETMGWGTDIIPFYSTDIVSTWYHSNGRMHQQGLSHGCSEWNALWTLSFNKLGQSERWSQKNLLCCARFLKSLLPCFIEELAPYALPVLFKVDYICLNLSDILKTVILFVLLMITEMI